MRLKLRQSRVKSRTRGLRAAQVFNRDRIRDDKALISAIRKILAGGSPEGPVARAFQEWCSIWDVPALANTVSVRANRRLRSSVARLVVADQCLELGPLFFSGSLNHREVLCHELAHAAAHMKYGARIRPHGPEWRDLIRAAGFEHRSGHARMGSQPSGAEGRRRTRRYEHRCPVCQSTWYARKRMKRWRCAACAAAGLPGHLDIRVLDFTSQGAVR